MAKRSREASISSIDEESPSVLSSIPASTEPRNHAPKYAQLDDAHNQAASMRCLLPPHKPINFSSYSEYENHYSQAHSNRCSDCKANFPTTHFLELHIAENHDPLIATRRENGEKTFACFVQGCDKVCNDWRKRRSHLVDKHAFPRNYDFLVVDSGIDGKRSMLRAGVDGQGHRASSRERGGSSETDVTTSTQATSASPPQSRALPKATTATKKDAPEKSNPTAGEATSPQQWKGKKRSGSTRSLPYGASVAPANGDFDSIINSMSALSMIPRSVQTRKK